MRVVRVACSTCRFGVWVVISQADVYRADSVGTSSGRVLWGSNLVGSGGEDTKSFLHGVLGGNEQTYEIVLQLFTVEVAAAQVVVKQGAFIKFDQRWGSLRS